MKEYSISLRIWHPSMMGDDIVARVGKPAVAVQNVGKPAVTPKGNPIGRISKESFCAFRLLDHWQGVFSEGVEHLLPELKQLAPLLTEVAESGGVAELYVWIFPEDDNNLGFTLEPSLVDGLSSLRLQLSVEILLMRNE